MNSALIDAGDKELLSSLISCWAHQNNHNRLFLFIHCRSALANGKG